MPIGLVVPSIEAAVEVARMIQSSYALYEAGHMTDEQLAAAWAAVGVSVKAADARWEAAGSRTAGEVTTRPK